MRIVVFVALAFVATMPALAGRPDEWWSLEAVSQFAPTNLTSPRLFVNSEIRSAAPSRGKMDSDRPHNYFYANALFETRGFGAIGLGYWSDSELTGRSDAKHRRCLFENDLIPFYRYTTVFAPGWRMRGDIVYDIKFFSGYVNRRVPDYHDVCLYLQLDNPYVTPVALLRRMVVPVEDNRFDFRTGAFRSFKLPWSGLTLTPGFYADGGNGTQVYRRYGARPSGSRDYVPGFNAIVGYVRLGNSLSSWCSAYVGVEDFHIVRKSSREIEDARDDPTARTDIILGVVGVTASF